MSRFSRRIAFAALSTLLGFAALELGVRLLARDALARADGLPPSPDDGAPTMKGNPYLLWELVPGSTQHDQGATAEINALGLRGPEPEIPKPPGVRRLLVTGDSSVYGYGVEDGEPFIDVAAQHLRRSSGAAIEGWNAAVPGYSSYQSLNLLQMRALALEPDVLVIANLWSDNNFDDFVDKELLSEWGAWRERPATRVHERLRASALYRLLHHQLRVENSPQGRARQVGWTVGGEGQIGKRRVALEDYQDNLERMAELAQGEGAELAFVILANREDLAGRQHSPAWDPYREVMRSAAERHGAPILDVPALFADTGLSADALFLDEMHPTALGHALIGEALATQLSPWSRGKPLNSGGSGEPPPPVSDPFVHAPEDGPDPGAAGPVQLQLRYQSMRGQRLQIDCIDLDSGERVGGARAQGPGNIALEGKLRDHRLGVVIYDDIQGDGPTSEDIRFDLREQPFTLQGQQRVIVDLDARSVRAE